MRVAFGMELQRLFYNRTELKDDRTLADYGIRMGDTMNLVLKV